MFSQIFIPFTAVSMYNNKKGTAVISMARRQKYNIQLTDKELVKLRSVIRKKETSKTIRSRCQIIIDLDEVHGKVLTHEQSARSNGVCMATVTNTVEKYINGGIDAVTELKRNINSDNARRKIDGRAEVPFQKCSLVGQSVCLRKNPKLF
jgi:hypothetical protein